MNILIDSNDAILDISKRVISATIKNYHKNRPTSLSISFISIDTDFFSEGDAITLKLDDEGLFSGYIFTISNNFDTVTIVAYDQIRYLSHRDTYIYSNKKASDVINQICREYNLKTGEIEDTQYMIPYRLEENQTIMDIINTALEFTEAFNGKSYILYDDFGEITLSSLDSMQSDFAIDCSRMATEFNMVTSIDKDVYNSVKVSVKDRKTQVISTYLEEDSENKKKWGTLRLFERLPNDYTSAQARNYAKNVLTAKNKLSEQFQLTYITEKFIRAGTLIKVAISENLIKTMLITEATYVFSNNQVMATLLLTNF